MAPLPPVRRFADVVRATVKTMELAGFGGNDLIARALARTGWRLSARMGGGFAESGGHFPRLPRFPDSERRLPVLLRKAV